MVWLGVEHWDKLCGNNAFKASVDNGTGGKSPHLIWIQFILGHVTTIFIVLFFFSFILWLFSDCYLLIYWSLWALVLLSPSKLKRCLILIFNADKYETNHNNSLPPLPSENKSPILGPRGTDVQDGVKGTGFTVQFCSWWAPCFPTSSWSVGILCFFMCHFYIGAHRPLHKHKQGLKVIKNTCALRNRPTTNLYQPTI